MYEAGFLDDRVIVLNRKESTTGKFGREAGEYEETGEYWCNWYWKTGAQMIREGSLDAFDTISVRMRFHENISRDSMLRHEGKDYQIIKFDKNKKQDKIDILCQEITK